MPDSNEKSVLPQIVIGVVVALVVGSSSPWWWSKLFPPARPSGPGEDTKRPVAPVQPEISQFAVAPEQITTGESATLRWTVANASGVSIEPGGSQVSLTGERTVRPSSTTAYTLSAYPLSTSDARGPTRATCTLKVVPRDKKVPPARAVETIQLTPDFGSKPIRSGTLVETGICPSGYGSSGVVPSTPDYIGVSGPMTFPGTSYQRGFLTFPLAALPRTAQVKQAHLNLRIGGLSGSNVYQCPLLVESVDIGPDLEKSDYASSGVLVATDTVGRLEANPGIDVTQAVRMALRDGLASLALRLRFQRLEQEYFNATDSGVLTVEYTR